MPIRHAFVIVIGLFPWTVFAYDCEDLNSGGVSWTTCKASQAFESSDKALNAAYRKVVSKLEAPEHSIELRHLIASQRAWLVFRDAQCRLVQQLQGGPTEAAELDCKAKITSQRTQVLEHHLLVESAGKQYRIVVMFGSLCCGPDRGAMSRVSSLIERHEGQIGRSLEKKWIRGGLEGDATLCLALEDRGAAEQATLVRQIQTALKTSFGTKLQENIRCKGGGAGQKPPLGY